MIYLKYSELELNVFENEEFTTRTKKDHGIAIHPSLMSAVDDEKKSGEVRNILHVFLYFICNPDVHVYVNKHVCI